MSKDLYDSNWDKGFSFRNGIKEIKREKQKESLNKKTRIKVLNLIHTYLESTPNFIPHVLADAVNIRNEFIKYFIEEFYIIELYKHGNDYRFKEITKNTIINGDWFEVFDFIEFWLYANSKLQEKYKNEIEQKYLIQPSNNIFGEFKELSRMINDIFKEEFVSYRVIGKHIAPIEDEAEIYSIKESIDSPYEEVSRHMEKALIHLSDRKEPDYSNSIKESISSVEAMSRLISGEENLTLGKTLNSLKKQGVYIHEAMEKAFKALYGYTSDSSGIRHSFKIGEKEPTFADAKFMLVACSAFNNYLLDNSKM